MRGRPPKELQAAITWLKERIKYGPISAKEVRTNAPASHHTMHKAKKFLGLVSQFYEVGWFWVRPNSGVIMLPIQPVAAQEPKEDDDYEPLRMNTKEMRGLISNMILLGKNDSEIIQECVLSCASWPMPKPYSRAYIESVVMSEIHGTDVRAELNENKE